MSSFYLVISGQVSLHTTRSESVHAQFLHVHNMSGEKYKAKLPSQLDWPIYIFTYCQVEEKFTEKYFYIFKQFNKFIQGKK